LVETGKTMKRLIQGIKIACWFLIGLGLVHLIGTPIALSYVNQLPRDQYGVFLFMYLAAGFALMYPGVITLFNIAALTKGSQKAGKTTLACSVCALLLAVLAVITMSDNPFSYLALGIGLAFIVLAFLLKKYCRERFLV
jgi:hypothetical protein